MIASTKNPVILMVDDDEEDIYITRRAFCTQQKNLVFNSVNNGYELFDYLNFKGAYKEYEKFGHPNVILLDINIPKENGFDILLKLKASDSKFKNIPVSIFTTSNLESDVNKAYQLGANSFVSKAITANGMTLIAEKFCQYWLSFVNLPQTEKP